MSRGMRWVVIAALMFLMLTSTRVGPMAIILRYLRWVPLFFLGLAALLIAVRNRALPRPLNKADAVMLGFVALALLSSLHSIDPEITLLRGLSVLLMYGAVFWGVWVYADEFGADEVVRIIVATAAIVFGLHIAFGLLDPGGSMPYHGRFRGWAHNPGTPGGQVALLLPLALWLALKRSRWQHWLLVGAMLLILILSQTRSEFAAAGVGSFYLLWRALPRRRWLVLASVLIVLVIGFAWVEVGPRLFPSGDHVISALNSKVASERGTVESEVASERGTVESEVASERGTVESMGVGRSEVASERGTVESMGVGRSEVAGVASEQSWLTKPNIRTEDAINLSRRTEKWIKGVQYLVEKPLLGFGFGTEDQLFAFHGIDIQDYMHTGAYIHQSYLGLALQLGLLGAALFFIPLGLLVVREIGRISSSRHDVLRSALLAVVIAALTSAFMTSWLYSMGNEAALPFWICVMLLVRTPRTA
ncbi:MAG: hypothetical protein CL877_09825 [Dehalococcoidales bacterium]|nr:hypothetical protein [Dehalococcoidales bacterium]